MTLNRLLGIVAMTAAGLVAWLGGFFVFLGLWAAIASDGEPDPNFSWRSYAETMAVAAATCIVFGGVALLLYFRLFRRHPT